MPDTPRRPRWALYWLTVIVVAAATVGVMLLAQNIRERKAEAESSHPKKFTERT